MQKLVLDKLTETLEAVPEVRAVYPPLFEGSIETYPSVIIAPDSFSNTFASTGTNRKSYQYQMWVMVQATQNKTASDIMKDTLLVVSDAVVKKLDQEWNGGAVDGHRLWFRTSAGLMGYATEDVGKVVWQQFTVLAEIETSVV